MRRGKLSWWHAAVVCLVGCGTGAMNPADSGTNDVVAADSGTTDAGTMDSDTTDAGTMDAGTTDAGADTGSPIDDVPPFDAGPRTTYSLDAITRYCVLTNTCEIFSGLTVSDCITDIETVQTDGADPGLLYRGLGCATSFTTCDAFVTCVNGGHDATYCTAHPGSTCDGDVAVSCAFAGGPPGGPSYVQDCSLEGLHCAVDSNGNAQCQGTGSACDPASNERSCQGSGIAYCASGQSAVVDCSLAFGAGAQCFNSGQCESPHATCGATDSTTCQGNYLVSCQSSGFGFAIDCDAATGGGTCASINGFVTCVAPSSAECQYGQSDTCEGNNAVGCWAGHKQSVDCTQLGFGSCMINGGGSAVCAP